MRGVLKPTLEILAAIPTVVYGYFALTAVTPLLRSLGVQVEIFNVLAGGLVMGVMLIPDDRIALRGRDGGRAAGPA